MTIPVQAATAMQQRGASQRRAQRTSKTITFPTNAHREKEGKPGTLDIPRHAAF